MTDYILIAAASLSWGLFLGWHWRQEKPRGFKIIVVNGRIAVREMR